MSHLSPSAPRLRRWRLKRVLAWGGGTAAAGVVGLGVLGAVVGPPEQAPASPTSVTTTAPPETTSTTLATAPVTTFATPTPTPSPTPGAGAGAGAGVGVKVPEPRVPTTTRRVPATTTAQRPAPPATTRTTTAAKAPKTSEKPASVYYKNCAAVQAAGAAPIHRGDPGYASHLDRDGDGVGCAGD